VTYQGVVGRIREDTKRKVMAAWRMYGVGTITRPQFLQLASAILGQAGTSAAAAADLAVSLELTRLNESLAAVAGVTNRKTQRTYMDALETVLDGDGDVPMKLERLSLNAPLESAQAAYGKALAGSGASGWVRQMDPDPCQLCRWWWREGRVWPSDHLMPTHPGCECVARPVTVTYTPRKVTY